MSRSLLNPLFPNLNNAFIWLNAVLLLAGIYVLGWKPDVVIIAYFLETIIIGVIHVFKLAIVLRFGDAQKAALPDPNNKLFSGVMVIPFFIFHYFFFIFVQSIFIFMMLADRVPSTDTFNVFSKYAFLLAQPDVLIAFLAIAFSHIASTLKNFVIPGEFRRTTVAKLYFQPYLRIFIQQFVTILALFLMLLGGGSAAATLLIAFRLVVDLILHQATINKDFKAQLLIKLNKNQANVDAENTKQGIDSFLEK